jgi:UDP-N-acetylmuramoyl-tripeptide--D-alanyl-D-alanine ligase
MPITTAPYLAEFTLDELIEATQSSTVIGASRQDSFSGGISTDTRQLGDSDQAYWYLPLVGERFDGHDFIEQAINAGAVGCIIRKAFAEQWDSNWLCNAIVVEDTTIAYQNIANWYRHNRLANTTVVGVTGSNGKTTVKTMLKAMVSPYYRVAATEQNFNNDIGVPKTILTCPPDTEVLIVEMGMRGLGEIARLSHCANPNIAVITNIGPAHIGRLGSLEAIAQAKSEIADGLAITNSVGKTLVIPQDDPLLTPLVQAAQQDESIHFLGFTTKREPSVTSFAIDDVEFTATSVHQAANTELVVNVGKALGLTAELCKKGLENYQPEVGRGTTVLFGKQNQHLLINDAYNANPASMVASVQSLCSQYPDHAPILILAGMKELGRLEADYHAETIKKIVGLLSNHPLAKYARLILVGDEMTTTIPALKKQDVSFSILPLDQPLTDELLERLLLMIERNLPDSQRWTILLKGSRFYRLDTLAQPIQQAFN